MKHKPPANAIKYAQDYRANTLRESFGLTLKNYYELQAKQGHTCAICKREETANGRGGKPMSLAVDHCHTTGKIRGLLCRRCNQSIGAFEDNPTLLRLAALYLEGADTGYKTHKTPQVADADALIAELLSGGN